MTGEGILAKVATNHDIGWDNWSWVMWLILLAASVALTWSAIDAFDTGITGPLGGIWVAVAWLGGVAAFWAAAAKLVRHSPSLGYGLIILLVALIALAWPVSERRGLSTWGTYGPMAPHVAIAAVVAGWDALNRFASFIPISVGALVILACGVGIVAYAQRA